jgi:GAF domain-containing protein
MNVAASRARISEDPRLEAAQRRLRESAGEADTLDAVREIVTGLLGCEEIALFIVNANESELLWSFGIDPKAHRTLDSFDDPGLQHVMRGEFHIAPATRAHANDSNPPVRAFVPILMEERTVAVLVMLRLLPQKLAFDESDVRLINLLSSETAQALFADGPNSYAHSARTNR